MGQPDNTVSGDLLSEPINLKTNYFPIDVTNATIYKYVIKFSPPDVSMKEKKFLTARFLAKLKINRKSESFIYDNKFEIILPNVDSELKTKVLHAVFFRRGQVVKGPIDSSEASSQEEWIPSEFLADKLMTRTSHNDARSAKITTSNDSIATGNEGMQLCTVYALEQPVNLKALDANNPSSKERQDILDVLSKILLREARDTSSVLVHGNKIFDIACEPAASAPVVELRRGLIIDTCMADSSLVRRITPCTGVFLKEMNLAGFLELLRSPENSARIPFNTEEINHLLKGVKVKKTYGKQEVVQILGLMVGNAKQETFYWNNHRTTTISNYMQKVYPASNNNNQPDNGCVLVGTPRHREILPTRLCSIVSGQHSWLPASRFSNAADADWQKSLTENASKCVSGWDAVLTKLLKCAISPVADRFQLKIPGYGQYSALRPTLSDPRDRVIEGCILEKHIPIHKEGLVTSQPILVFVFGSAEVKISDSFLSSGLTKYFESSPSLIKYHKVQDDDFGRLILDARREFQSEMSAVRNPKPAIIGLFCKPSGVKKPGSTTEQELEFNELHRVYGNLKLYCHKEGYHFAGTFLQPTIKTQDDRRTRPAVLNTMHRLRTKIASVKIPNALTMSADKSPGLLMLGVHVAQLAARSSHPPETGKQQAAGYLLSVVARWSGSDHFPQSRTFLLPSSISVDSSDNDRKLPFTGASAMELLTKSELLTGISLANATIAVFRAGLSPEMLQPKQTIISESSEKLQRERQRSEQTANNTGSSEKTNGASVKHAVRTRSEVQSKMSAINAEEAGEVENSSTGDHLGLRSEFLPNNNSDFKTEVEALRSFADGQNARLVYCTVSARTNARLFNQTGQPLFQDNALFKEVRGTNIIKARRVSSILVAHSKPTPTIDWLIQKRFDEQAGANTPLLLRFHPIDGRSPDNAILRNAIFEACWDFPAGTWSSKNLSCVALAKKANRHAMRIIDWKGDGKAEIPEVHADLKGSLYFI